MIGGAASATLEPIADIIHEPVASAPALIARSSPAERAAALIASDSNKAAQSEEHDATQQVAQPSTVREENGELQDPDTGEIPVIRKSDGRYSADPNDPEVMGPFTTSICRRRSRPVRAGFAARSLAV